MRGIEADQAGSETYGQALRSGRAILAGEFSRGDRVRYRLTRPPVLSAFGVGAIALAAVLVWQAGVLEQDTSVAMHPVDVVAPDGTVTQEFVNAEGLYTADDGQDVVVEVFEPLPAEVRADIEAGLDGLSGSEVTARLGEKMSTTSKAYVAITATSLSCDGEEYFDGFAVSGDVDWSTLESESEACEMQRTKEGAAELAAMLVEASAPGLEDTYEIFEVEPAVDEDVYVPDDGDVVVQGDVSEPVPMSEDELQTHGGDA